MKSYQGQLTSSKYENLRDKFIKRQEEVLELLRTKDVGNFESIPVKCVSLNSKECERIVSDLRNKGISNNSSLLYYFTLEEPTPQVLEKVSKLKSDKSIKIALPKVNAHNDGSETLYVGKSNSDFFSRMQYHLGNRSYKSTYALHLVHWAKELKLNLTLYYSLVELKKEELFLLEMLESVLHRELNPLLGREGH